MILVRQCDFSNVLFFFFSVEAFLLGIRYDSLIDEADTILRKAYNLLEKFFPPK